MCALQELNSVTVNDSYQVFRVSNVLEQLGQAQYITTLDLSIGYYLVPVNARYKNKTPFVSPYGKY